MQRTRTNRGVKKGSLIAILLLALLVMVDQLSKIFFRTIDVDVAVIKNFFYLTYVENTGAAWGFLAGKSWAQLFFKILTGVSLIIFFSIFFYACKKRYAWLKISIVLVLAGTIGNFIDRLIFSSVTDFLEIVIGNVAVFGVFNIADVYLCVGILMTVIHFLFLDEGAIFKKNGNKKDNG